MEKENIGLIVFNQKSQQCAWTELEDTLIIALFLTYSLFYSEFFV
jgi:hypothetical protein